MLLLDRQQAADLDGIGWLLEHDVISMEQAGRMAARVHARNPRAITSPPVPAIHGGVAGAGVHLPRPPVPLERLRRLSPEQQWQALVFLSGLVPDAVELAMAAVITPLSIGVAR